jgi:hypothetical protein
MSEVVAADKMVTNYTVAGASEEHTAQLASRIAYNLLMQAAGCKDFTVRLELYPTELISQLQNKIKELEKVADNLRERQMY